MAEGFATQIISVVVQKLADEALKKIVRAQGIRSELDELRSTLSDLQDLLSDASQKEITDKSVMRWLNRLRHLAYDIDDILDDVATEAIHRELTKETGGITSKVRKLIPPCCTNFSLSHRFHGKLDSITTKLHSINTKLQNLEKQNNALGLIVKGEKPKSNSRKYETSLPDASSVFGREGEKEKLLNKLLSDEPSKANFSIIPIVGIGGIGKTTLARVLYNDTRVKDHFEIQAWVCVSDDFDILKISNTLYQLVSGENKKFEDLNKLQIDLIKKLKDKRFLLVLDDVWKVNYEDWENLVRPFYLGAHGSRIINATRKEKLLKKLGFDHVDQLLSLSPKDALSLFALHALGVENFESHAKFKPYGEGIVKKCGGLPLALRALGRLMKTKANEEDWDEVLNSNIWDLENADEIVPALRLSYHDLSADLKQLFVYCSLFPKDFMFEKDELVLLWMAEGFLSQSQVTKSPERLGHEYFENLLSRSFFQHAPNEESLFVMHDLMNDLATFVAGEFFLRFDNHMDIGNEALAKYHHMSFIREEYVGYHNFGALKRARSLRTLLAVSVEQVDQGWKEFYLSNKILVDLLPELSLLRVLSLSCFWINEVPEFIGSLKHLRYLNLSKTQIKELPDNVGNLYNLQSLIVFGCENLTKLPKSFLKLRKLRHFDVRDTPLLEKLPLGISELKNLHTLTKIIIEGDNGFAISDLKAFKNLHGIISIQGLQNVQSPMHAREVNSSLKRITELELKWGDDVSRRDTLEKEVLNELRPHSDKLKELTLMSYEGIEFPNWVGDPSFNQLVHVSLHGSKKCTSLPPLGQLPSLKELFIQDMSEVKVIGLELTGSTVVAFPSLEVLSFKDMSGLEVWSTNIEVLDAVFPCLRELQIKNCPKLTVVTLEALPLVRVLRLGQCSYTVLRSLVQAASLITKLVIKSISGLTDEVWRGVIKYLGAVEKLKIKYCDEIRYLWESQANASKFLVNLKKLDVEFCENLMSLGEKEEEDNFGNNCLSSLRILEIAYCDNMKHCCCPNNIERLDISECDSLTHFFFPTTTTKGGQELKSLVISGGKKLTENINISMPMLDFVYIVGWTNLKSITDLSTFIHLTSLLIEDCQSLESFPDLQLSKLTLLEHMVIKKCPNIDAYFPRGHWPPKLLSLKIGGLKKPISEWGSQNFPTSLTELWLCSEDVSNFSQLSNLLPSSLTKLVVKEFDKLESLSMGLQHLTSLQHLIIQKCPKMIHLPETLLPSLLRMLISECPNLSKRCKGRDYWPHISHIPCINLE